MTGDWSNSPPNSAAICWKSCQTGTAFSQYSSADNCAPNNGTSISAPILVDAILNRLVHTAYKIDLKG